MRSTRSLKVPAKRRTFLDKPFTSICAIWRIHPTRTSPVLSPRYCVGRQLPSSELPPSAKLFKANPYRMDYGLIPCLIVDQTTDVILFNGYWILAIYDLSHNRICVYDGFGNSDIVERFPGLPNILVGASRVLTSSHNVSHHEPRVEMTAADSYNCAAEFSQMPFAIAMMGELFAHGNDILMLQPDLDMKSFILRVLAAFRALDDGLELRTPHLAQLRRHILSQQSDKHSTIEVQGDEDALTEADVPTRMPRRSVGSLL